MYESEEERQRQLWLEMMRKRSGVGKSYYDRIPQEPAAPKPQTAKASQGQMPRGIRNNNPGNIEYGKFTQNRGALGSDGRFAKFATPEQGIKAMHDLLGGYQNRGLNTVNDMIGRWAPSSENNTSAYARAVSERMGIKPDQAFNFRENPELAQKMLEAMIQHENGMMPFSREQIASAIGGGQKSSQPRPDMLNATPEPVQQAKAPPPPPPPTSLAQKADQPATSTSSPFGQSASPFGQFGDFLQAKFSQSPVGQMISPQSPPTPAAAVNTGMSAVGGAAAPAAPGMGMMAGLMGALGGLAGNAQQQQQIVQQHQQQAAEEQRKRMAYAMSNWGFLS